MPPPNRHKTELRDTLLTGVGALDEAILARPLRCAAYGAIWVGTLLTIACSLASPIGEALLGGVIAAAGVFLVCCILYLAVRRRPLFERPTAAPSARTLGRPRALRGAPDGVGHPGGAGR